MTRMTAAICLVLCAVLPGAARVGEAFAQAAASAQPGALSQGQLDAIMAPVALYPDPLLSKILIASGYPDQVLEASKWRKENPGMTGDTLDRAVAAQPWDDNVKALVLVPGILDMMSGQQDWMYQVGGAFVNQQADVMASVQRLRHQARVNGSLVTTEQQRIVEERNVIIIEPAQPDVVYVPYYDPRVVYGSWLYPEYVPYYWGVPYGYPVYPGAGLIWGTRFLARAAIWHNAFEWHNNNVWVGGGYRGDGTWNGGHYNRGDFNRGQGIARPKDGGIRGDGRGGDGIRGGEGGRDGIRGGERGRVDQGQAKSRSRDTDRGAASQRSRSGGDRATTRSRSGGSYQRGGSYGGSRGGSGRSRGGGGRRR